MTVLLCIDMRDGIYLLSMEELYKSGLSSELWKSVLAKLDKERLNRLQGKSVSLRKRQAECAAGGLLLQLAVGEALAKQESAKAGGQIKAEGKILSVEEALRQIGQRLELKYRYGKNGKPYFSNYPFYFSISHSDELVLCVLSEQEIGADIQKKVSADRDSVVYRFFSEKEKQCWKQSPEAEKSDLFYRLWCFKEAYGKLTGEGIMASVGLDMGQTMENIRLSELDIIKGYQITVCKWKENMRTELNQR